MDGPRARSSGVAARTTCERFARDVRGGAERGARLVDGHHAARLRHGQRAARSSTWRWRAATSAGRAPASCRSAGTPACRAAPRWARTRPCSPAACPIDAESRGAPRGAVRLPDRPTARAHRRRRWSRPRARRDRRALVERRQLPRRAARSGGACATALETRAAARPPGHRASARRCSSTRRTRSCCCPARDPLRAARRRHRDHDRAPRRLLARDPAAHGRRGAHRVGDLRRPRRHVDPARARLGGLRVAASRSATRSPGGALLRRHRAAVQDRRPGPVGRRAALRRLGLPDADGKAHFTVVRAARGASCEPGRFLLSHAARQAVQHRWSGRPRTR